MNAFDFSPLFRSTVGFDRMFSALDQAMRVDDAALSYPPYNIEKTGEDRYRITMALAGFTANELSMEVRENVLTVAGRPAAQADGAKYLHRGIAGRGFERRFQLADHVEVTGAELVNGLLHIELKREIPDSMKPRRIEIATGNPSKARLIEGEATKAA